MISSTSWNCIEPYIMQVRNKNQNTKKDMYRLLNIGQKALFSFYVYYNHVSKDIDRFIYFTNHFRSIGFLSEISKGSDYFKDKDFSIFIDGLNKTECIIDYRILFDELLIKGKRHIELMDSMVQSCPGYNQEQFA